MWGLFGGAPGSVLKADEADPRRISISAASADGEQVQSREFCIGGRETLLFGGNYVFKAKPYFPPRDIVLSDAQRLMNELERMPYTAPPGRDGVPKLVVPCVRLGAMLEGARPDKGTGVDPTWAANLEATIDAFAEAGVYVILDVHADAFCTTNGGVGFPWWMASEMQSNAGCCQPMGECYCCCFCCGVPNPSYITTPDHPLALSIPESLARCLGMPHIETAPGDKDPWKAFSVGGDSGNPAHMNVGNLSMRMNNTDSAWSRGILGATRQVHNFGPRLYNSHRDDRDRKAIFDPYYEHVEYLCRKWDKHWNVVAVELLNEPFLTGLPNVWTMLRSRRDLFDFHHAVLDRLDACDPPVKAPIAIQDGYGSIGGASVLSKLLSVVPISGQAQKKLRDWGNRNQLILSFHYYPGPALSAPTAMEFPAFVKKAQRQAADMMGHAPLFLSEFWGATPQDMAERMAEGANLGINAITYWQFVDTEFTGTPGWYKYPSEITDIGLPISSTGEVNQEAWDEYVKTVQDETFWGAMICGAAGGQGDVLSFIPGSTPAPMSYYKLNHMSRRVCCCLV